MVKGQCGSFPKLLVPFWGPNNTDYNIVEVYIGGPLILGNYHVVTEIISNIMVLGSLYNLGIWYLETNIKMMLVLVQATVVPSSKFT